MALWGGRFEEGVDDFTQRFGASLPVDKQMYAEDIAGSRAHAKMLAAQGIISAEDQQKIDAGLEGILHDIEAGNFTFDINDEDIHMAVEAELTRRIGSAGARLHTGRSRNDQVITDTRLLAKELCAHIMKGNVALRCALVDQAKAHPHVVMPGYTHMQHAQPVLFSHHLLAYFWMFSRDFARLQFALDQADENPLGSAALAGTTYPLDRQMTTRELGFARPTANSLDAVSNRDFLLDLDYACAVSMMHLSRLAEEVILWSTQEFGFITLSDSYSTGSSIMPQKKNPDFAELIRGKSGRVYGDLMALLTTMKGLPLAYNKDMQEDKEGVIDAAHTLVDSMRCMAGMIATAAIHPDAMMASARKGHMAATDVADYLAKKGMPFRDAHAVVGHLVLECEKRGCSLDDLSLADFKKESDLFEEDITGALDLPAIVDARTTEGGTGSAAVAAQLEKVQARLAADEAALSA
ncbi:MAG: argininosuccinate lyase [Eggerthellaceae bacterium]|jgi:argininosuccinate lyase|nr:argininosuccinate lyase [Eggerthellaceae bacterium]